MGVGEGREGRREGQREQPLVGGGVATWRHMVDSMGSQSPTTIVAVHPGRYACGVEERHRGGSGGRGGSRMAAS